MVPSIDDLVKIDVSTCCGLIIYKCYVTMGHIDMYVYW